MNPFALLVFQTVCIVLLSPLTMGMVRKVKARLQGRVGAPVWLPYIALLSLMRKEMVISTSTTWVFRVVPFVVFGTTLCLAAVLPLMVSGGAGASLSHFVVVAALLALGSIFLVFGGLDAASAFGGMGAEREMTLAALVEPAVIMSFAGLAYLTHTPLVDGMLPLPDGFMLTHPFFIFTALALVLVALAENARYPVDNPATHLELTMVHEAMLLEYSGPYLALLEWASCIKLTVFALLIGHVLYPTALLSAGGGVGALLGVLALTVVKLAVAMVLLGLLESVIAKMRFYRMQEYMAGAFLLALAGFLFALLPSML